MHYCLLLLSQTGLWRAERRHRWRYSSRWDLSWERPHVDLLHPAMFSSSSSSASRTIWDGRLLAARHPRFIGFYPVIQKNSAKTKRRNPLRWSSSHQHQPLTIPKRCRDGEVNQRAILGEIENSTPLNHKARQLCSVSWFPGWKHKSKPPTL